MRPMRKIPRTLSCEAALIPRRTLTHVQRYIQARSQSIPQKKLHLQIQRKWRRIGFYINMKITRDLLCYLFQIKTPCSLISAFTALAPHLAISMFASVSTMVCVCVCAFVLTVCTVHAILQGRYKRTTNPERQRNKHNP